MMSRRRTEALETRVAGIGGDGNLYGVTSVVAKSAGKGAYRKKVCPTCPWRLDAEVGRFPADAFRDSASTAKDGAMNTFACHESGVEAVQTCAGFLRANSAHNVGVRIAIACGSFDPGKLVEDVPLYDSYRDMAIANGVPADDPAIAECRGDDEDWTEPAKRTGRKFPIR